MNDPINEPLQDFSFQHSQYQRPNQPVVYVPLADDEQAIPDGKERYVDPAVSGGDQVKPFVAKRSLRQCRTIFSMAMTALTFGLLLIAFNSSWSRELIAPGPLSSPHAQILGKLGSERCAACHQAANQSFGQWVKASLGFTGAETPLTETLLGHTPHKGHIDGRFAGQAAATNQSQLCMKCHGETFDRDSALNPHGVSNGLLDRLTQASAGSDWSNGLTGTIAARLGMAHGNHIACNACHREHHGNVSLSQLTDQQCQSCHQQSFHSFENGHPEFSIAPQQRRQRIAFDHGTHRNKHFLANKTSFDCAQCHIDDLTKNTKLTAPFEQSCGACHQQEIADSGDLGWALLALPMVDMEAVQQHGLSIGNWPMAATGDFDGPLPPMMSVLLAADPQVKKVLDKVGDTFAFGDIDPDDQSSVADGVALVWGIKRLLHDLASGGQDRLREKLARATGKEVSNETLTRLLAGLNPKVFAATAKRWLPDLERELEMVDDATGISHRRGLLHQSNERFAFVGMVQGRLALQELLAENPLSDGRSEISDALPPVVTDSNLDLDKDSGFDSGRNEPAAAHRKAALPPEGAELLVENPLQNDGEFLTNTRHGTGAAGGMSALPTRTALPGAAHHRSSWKIPDEIQIRAKTSPVSFQPGWYRSDRRFVLGYRPVEHADTLVKSWSDFAAANSNSGTDCATARLLASVNSKSAAGSCRSCHTIDHQPDGSYAFQWTSNTRGSGEAGFTKFAHRPHLILPQLQDCNYCHRMDESRSLVGTFDDFDPMVATKQSSNFHPQNKVDCAACHRKGHTESGCMQCHNYHVGRKPQD